MKVLVVIMLLLLTPGCALLAAMGAPRNGSIIDAEERILDVCPEDKVASYNEIQDGKRQKHSINIICK